MPLRFLVSALLVVSTLSKRVPLILKKEKSHQGEDSVNREVFPVQRCSLRSVTTRCSARPVPLLFRHAKIFGDNLPNTVSFPVQLTCDQWNSQTTITTNRLDFKLEVDLSPAYWRPPASGVIFHHLLTLFKPLVLLKDTRGQHCVIFVYLLKHFKR